MTSHDSFLGCARTGEQCGAYGADGPAEAVVGDVVPVDAREVAGQRSAVVGAADSAADAAKNDGGGRAEREGETRVGGCGAGRRAKVHQGAAGHHSGRKGGTEGEGRCFCRLVG